MSRWFKDRRQEFIAATLRQFGQIRRGDIMREFGVTVTIASSDIFEFLCTKPPRAEYDVRTKTYIVVDDD